MLDVVRSSRPPLLASMETTEKLKSALHSNTFIKLAVCIGTSPTNTQLSKHVYTYLHSVEPRNGPQV